MDYPGNENNLRLNGADDIEQDDNSENLQQSIEYFNEGYHIENEGYDGEEENNNNNEHTPEHQEREIHNLRTPPVHSDNLIRMNIADYRNENEEQENISDDSQNIVVNYGEGYDVNGDAENFSNYENIVGEARDHVYLPGTSHPLYPEFMLFNKRRRVRKGSFSASTNKGDSFMENTDESERLHHYDHHDVSIARLPTRSHRQLIELPILELKGVVVYPGSSIPIRLRNRHWIEYLGRKIDRSRGIGTNFVSSEEVRLGIITYVETSNTSQAGEGVISTAPTSTSTSTAPQRQGLHRRRGTWMRSAIFQSEGRTTLPLSRILNAYERLLQERGFEYSEEDTDSDIGEDGSNDNNVERGGHHSMTESNDIPTTLHSQREQRSEDELIAEEPGDNYTTSRTSIERQQTSTDNADPLIGRIGCMATITYTHEDVGDDFVDSHQESNTENNDQQHSRVWQRSNDNTGQLVITALVTGRFRIVSCVDDTNDYNSSRDRQHYRHLEMGDMRTVRMYMVEELHDEELPLPPFMLRRKLTRAPSNGPAKSQAENESMAEKKTSSIDDIHALPYLRYHSQIIRNLARVTSMPTVAYNIAWPWRLVGLIRSAIDRIHSFEGLRKIIPPLPPGGNGSSIIGERTTACNISSRKGAEVLEPTSFSFLMASNMPFSEREKINLLQMDTVQRLRFIYDKILEEERNNASSFICCKSCLRPISRASNLFTVGGAEGTTGNYVNEHGVIHQTITVRQVRQRTIYYSGSPELRDTWFPGYMWTIASCIGCCSHLGWKFDKVRRQHCRGEQHLQAQQAENECVDRPLVFWGLSGASVSTQIIASGQNGRNHNEEE